MSVASNNRVKVDTEYQIDQSVNFIITAIPKYNNYNTSFTFEYHTDGDAFPWYEVLYNQVIHKNEKKEQMLVFAYIVAALFLCVLCFCLYCCFQKCCGKKLKINPSELTASGYLSRNKGTYDDENELQSMSDSDGIGGVGP